MFTVKTTDAFDAWLDSLRDKKAQHRIVARLRKISCGLFGDVKPIKGGISEVREHFGPGYRIYFTQREQTLIIVLAGGNKASQQSDIDLALKLAQQLEY